MLFVLLEKPVLCFHRYITATINNIPIEIDTSALDIKKPMVSANRSTRMRLFIKFFLNTQLFIFTQIMAANKSEITISAIISNYHFYTLRSGEEK